MRSAARFAAILALLVFPVLAQARTVPAWDIGELFAKSDLVLIVTHVRTSDATEAGDKAPFDDPEDSQMLTPVVSVLTVHRVLKGVYAESEFGLRHHRFDWDRYGPKGIGNGPRLIVFPKETDRLTPKKEYMLFLKRNQNGMLLPVTGMFDPLYSLKELVTPKMDYSVYGIGWGSTPSADEE